MSQVPAMRGIKGLQHKEPVGAVLTIGTKGDRGSPVDRDRFWIKVPDSSSDVRTPHPAFASYNFFPPAPEDAAPDVKQRHREKYHAQRRSVRGVIVHATEQECFEYMRKAQKLPKPFANHSKLPSCTGDGVTAKRLMIVGSDADYAEMACPGELCQYAQQPDERTPAACKPFARLLFQPVWKEESPLPTPLMKFTTQSWHSIAAMVGFFAHIKEQAALCGVANPRLFGMPFELTLTEKSSPEKRTKFPVIRMTPLAGVQDFLIKQQLRQLQIVEGQRTYAGLLDAGERSAEVISMDTSEVSCSVPRGEK